MATVVKENNKHFKFNTSFQKILAMCVVVTMLVHFYSLSSVSLLTIDEVSRHVAISQQKSKGEPSKLRGPEYNLCNIEHWLSELSKEEEGLLPNLNEEDIEFLHATFSINGNKNSKASDSVEGSADRGSEIDMSVSCLKTTLPSVAYQEKSLGSFGSYKEGLSAQHHWLATTRQQESNFSATFIIDTDVYANPQSQVTGFVMTRALKNVDLALVYNPEHDAPDEDQRIIYQRDGVQAGIIGMRHNKRTQLFNDCVSQILTVHTANPKIRQQWAINHVLESPVSQLLRIRWLPPEFHCWSYGLHHMEEFVVDNGPGVRKVPCFFVHSHKVAANGNVC